MGAQSSALEEGDVLLWRSSIRYSADGAFIPGDIARIISRDDSRDVTTSTVHRIPVWNRVGLVVNRPREFAATLKAYFKEHDPAMLPRVDAIAASTIGRREEMVAKIVDKYGGAPFPRFEEKGLMEASSRGITITPLAERIAALRHSGAEMAVRKVSSETSKQGLPVLGRWQSERLGTILDIAEAKPEWTCAGGVAEASLQAKAAAAFCGRVLDAAVGAPRHVVQSIGSDGELTVPQLLNHSPNRAQLQPWVNADCDVDGALSAWLLHIVFNDIGLSLRKPRRGEAITAMSFARAAGGDEAGAFIDVPLPGGVVFAKERVWH
jgi:hypothetical protein